MRSLLTGLRPMLSRVLRAFVQTRLAGMQEGEVLLAACRTRWLGEAKPQVADIIAQMERLGRKALGERGKAAVCAASCLAAQGCTGRDGIGECPANGKPASQIP